MKLYSVIDKIKRICYTLPNVNTVLVGDVYGLNELQDIKYSAMVINEQTHTHNHEEEYNVYGLNIFYVDRETSDKSNVLDIHSHATDVLIRVVDYIEELGGIITNQYSINTFEERFDSVCAGAYVTINVRFDLDICEKLGLVTSVNGETGDIKIKESTEVFDFYDGDLYLDFLPLREALDEDKDIIVRQIGSDKTYIYSISEYNANEIILHTINSEKLRLLSVRNHEGYNLSWHEIEWGESFVIYTIAGGATRYDWDILDRARREGKFIILRRYNGIDNWNFTLQYSNDTMMTFFYTSGTTYQVMTIRKDGTVESKNYRYYTPTSTQDLGEDEIPLPY